MRQLYRLSIHDSYLLEQAWNSLESKRIEILYGSEEENYREIFAYLSKTERECIAAFPWLISYHPYTLPSIDWHKQWATHAPYFKEGCIHLESSCFPRLKIPLCLKPGAGFGDLSHPTTCLMLDLLAKYLNTQIVIDIGCGSGILSLAALSMGAPFIYGIDIDSQALEHSLQNALMNQLNTQCIFCIPIDFVWQPTSNSVLILMNMIQREQQVAWSSLPLLHHQKGGLLTSGIRIEERKNYLEYMHNWGWQLQEEREKQEWLACYFTKSL